MQTSWSARRERTESLTRRLVPAIQIILAVAATAAAADESSRIVRDVAYVHRGDRRLKADLYLPDGEGPHPAVLMLHGGAWAAGNKTHNAWHARRLAKAGYVAVAIEYRLAPLHRFPAQLEDCRQALTWIVAQADAYRLDAERLAAFGYSAGGHLACLLALTLTAEPAATRPRLRAVVAGGAPCDFRNEPKDSARLAFWLGGTRREVPAAYQSASPAHYATDRAPPTFFFHGERDRVVPVSNPLGFHRRLQEQGIVTQFHSIPNAGHLRAYIDWQAFQHAVQFLHQHVRDAHDE